MEYSKRDRSRSSEEDRKPDPSVSSEPPKKTFKRSTSTLASSEGMSEGSGEPSTSRSQSIVKTEPEERKDRRYRFDLVNTRPADIQSKVGQRGEKIVLKTNYFRVLTKPNWKIHQYHIKFEPELDAKHIRAGILSTHRDKFGGFLYDGTSLFSSIKLDDTTLQGRSKKDENYEITVKYVATVLMTEYQSLQILNLILRRSMEGLKLQYIGRNFFDPAAKIDIREFRLQLWPGYQTSIRQHEQDILLSAEITHKVMRIETLYDILHRCTESGDYREEFRRQVLGIVVLTEYNNKTYRINDVDFESTPRLTFKMKDKEVSFLDYYYQKYNIRIRDPKQPLLVSKPKERDIRGGGNETVLLVPELCRPTGLTETMRSNFQLMRAMSDHTRMSPDRRLERLSVFNRRLQSTEESIKVLKDWNMALDKNVVELTGRILDPQKIYFNAKKVFPGPNTDWTSQFRTNTMYTSRSLDRWSSIGTNRGSRDLRNFIDALIRAADGMGMRISRPREVILHDDRNHSYIGAVDDCCRQDPQLILCLVPNNNAERYSCIKKKTCLERAIPSQIITQRCASNQRGLMSIATKVAIQINSKLGYAPWSVEIPLPSLMTIGYDVAKSTRDRSKSFGALVSTMDFKKHATFFSTVAEGSSHDVLANSLWPMMVKALRQYMSVENELPKRIVFYRDGVSEGSLDQLYNYEVKDVVEKLNQEYERAKAKEPPRFAYIVVTKSQNTKFFKNGQNPPPGTIVDDVVTLPERYDFFLVSQSVRQGTVSPTCYNVIYSNVGLAPDHLQLLTYKMTHLYYNWSGTTRVPAVCQYAKKLATLVATSLHQPPKNALERKLFYL